MLTSYSDVRQCHQIELCGPTHLKSTLCSLEMYQGCVYIASSLPTAMINPILEKSLPHVASPFLDLAMTIYPSLLHRAGSSPVARVLYLGCITSSPLDLKLVRKSSLDRRLLHSADRTWNCLPEHIVGEITDSGGQPSNSKRMGISKLHHTPCRSEHWSCSEPIIMAIRCTSV